MRRIVLITTALGVLVAAASAYAAINTYQANVGFTSKKAGTAKKPVPIGFTLDLAASGTNGNRSAVLLDIKTKMYGIKLDGKDFPTCSLSRIAAAKNDNVCPKGSEVATGAIKALLGSATNFSSSAPGVATCDPQLDVWNSGQGKLTFFFVDTPTHQCLGGALHTGSTGPYPATYKQQGKYTVTDVPIPSYIDFPVPGLAGSLINEHLKFFSTSKKVKGKTVAPIASVGCQGKKRPYSVTFTSNLPPAGTAKETDTVSKSAPC
ncbi:MAG: hypothetical protein ACR2MK_03630 [Solirubrobacteraceae bacterium]